LPPSGAESWQLQPRANMSSSSSICVRTLSKLNTWAQTLDTLLLQAFSSAQMERNRDCSEEELCTLLPEEPFDPETIYKQTHRFGSGLQAWPTQRLVYSCLQWRGLPEVPMQECWPLFMPSLPHFGQVCLPQLWNHVYDIGPWIRCIMPWEDGIKNFCQVLLKL
jgi:hypothetical protein